MNSQVLTVVLALTVAITAPLILNLLTSRQARTMRKEDWERQDAVARAAKAEADHQKEVADEARDMLAASVAASTARAEDAARILAARTEEAATQAAKAAALLLAAQRDTIDRTNEVARLAALNVATTDAQLKQIHTLVNSEMTAARQAELDQTRITLIMLRKVVAMDKANGREPEPEDLEAIITTGARITELQAILADRLAAFHDVEAQQVAVVEAAKKVAALEPPRTPSAPPAQP